MKQPDTPTAMQATANAQAGADLKPMNFLIEEMDSRDLGIIDIKEDTMSERSAGDIEEDDDDEDNVSACGEPHDASGAKIVEYVQVDMLNVFEKVEKRIASELLDKEERWHAERLRPGRARSQCEGTHHASASGDEDDERDGTTTTTEGGGKDERKTRFFVGEDGVENDNAMVGGVSFGTKSGKTVTKSRDGVVMEVLVLDNEESGSAEDEGGVASRYNDDGSIRIKTAQEKIAQHEKRHKSVLLHKKTYEGLLGELSNDGADESAARKSKQGTEVGKAVVSSRKSLLADAKDDRDISTSDNPSEPSKKGYDGYDYNYELYFDKHIPDADDDGNYGAHLVDTVTGLALDPLKATPEQLQKAHDKLLEDHPPAPFEFRLTLSSHDDRVPV